MVTFYISASHFFFFLVRLFEDALKDANQSLFIKQLSYMRCNLRCQGGQDVRRGHAIGMQRAAETPRIKGVTGGQTGLRTH